MNIIVLANEKTLLETIEIVDFTLLFADKAGKVHHIRPKEYQLTNLGRLIVSDFEDAEVPESIQRSFDNAKVDASAELIQDGSDQDENGG